jgi:cold shock protein
VLDSPDTPGGCWAHFSAVATAGYRRLAPDEQVQFDWELADQDGFAYRALRVWPVGQEPVERPACEPSEAYRSTLRLDFDESG